MFWAVPIRAFVCSRNMYVNNGKNDVMILGKSYITSKLVAMQIFIRFPLQSINERDSGMLIWLALGVHQRCHFKVTPAHDMETAA